jgi:hypothetical protein
MKTDVHLLNYLAEFFLEREIFQTEVTEKVETRFMFNSIFHKIVRLMTQRAKIYYSRTADR